MVRVKVTEKGEVSYELLSLDEPILESLEELDLAHWLVQIQNPAK